MSKVKKPPLYIIHLRTRCGCARQYLERGIPGPEIHVQLPIKLPMDRVPENSSAPKIEVRIFSLISRDVNTKEAHYQEQ